MSFNNEEIIILMIFIISLAGMFLLKKMKEYIYSYLLFEVGLLIPVVAIISDINPWGKIAYSSIGIAVITLSLIAVLVAMIYRFYRKRATQHPKQ